MEDNPRLDAWRVIGPGGGGSMYAPTLSPHDPNVVLVHCDMTGAYISHNGGGSWRMVNLATGVHGFVFDPTDPDVIYGYNVGLWRSEDRGATWRLVWPDPAKGAVEHRRGDHANYGLTSDDASYPSLDCHIIGVGVDAVDGRRLHLACRGHERVTTLLASMDRGATWAACTDLGRQTVHAIRAEGGRAWVLAETGTYVSDGGRDWRHLAGPGGRIVAGAVSDSGAGPTIYAIAAAGPADRHVHRRAGGQVCISSDGGARWDDVTATVLAGIGPEESADPATFRRVACCRSRPQVAYLSFSFSRSGGARGASVRCGIAKSDDGGRTWAVVWQEQGKPSPNMETTHIEPRMPDGYPNIYYVAPHGLGVAPTDPDVCFATDIFRTYATADGGGSWRSCHSRKVAEGRWQTTGLDVTTNYGVHFDPFDPQHLFITYTDIGLFASEDGGRSWSIATVGIPSRWRNTTYWLAFDPDVRGLMWGAFALNHDLPRPKMWRAGSVDRYEGGVAVSTDGGGSWSVAEGLPQTAATHLLLDPTSPVGRRTLYVCGFGRGVFKSVDNGETWALKNHGLTGEHPFAWRLTRADDGTLYLVIARRSEMGEFGDEGDGALYRSSDGAESWQKMTLPAGCNGPCALTLDPTDNHRMYLSAWGRPVIGNDRDGFASVHPAGASAGEDTGGGVFLSEDGGESWRCLFDRDQHVYDVTVGPADPRVLYLCGFDSAAHRSTDGGETWEPLRGYNFKWGHRVILDPQDAGKVYITTYGGSVWHGPAAGDPSAAGDVVTPLPRA